MKCSLSQRNEAFYINRSLLSRYKTGCHSKSTLESEEPFFSSLTPYLISGTTFKNSFSSFALHTDVMSTTA